MITIVGGIYHEHCMHPNWHEIYGSGGRAASAIAAMQEPVELHGFMDAQSLRTLEYRAAFESVTLQPILIPRGISFRYVHTLASPIIEGDSQTQQPLHVKGEKVIRFGMLEGEAIVEADYAVYDPQNVFAPEPFHQNGSKANHLAVVLNEHEARHFSQETSSSPEDLISAIVAQSGAEVVVLKRGALGALVWCGGVFTSIPAYQTNQVWKIGSGDVFVAHFGYQWMCRSQTAELSADIASKATAYYCQTRGFATEKRLSGYAVPPVEASPRFKEGYRPCVYLAGPFFTLAQRWLVEETRKALLSAGLRVFSPLHDVGYGPAEQVVDLDLKGIRDSDMMCAIGDGLDAGTIYEIGYARALEKPVVFYCENESTENKKMMQGSQCTITDDFATAIYQTLWAAMKL